MWLCARRVCNFEPEKLFIKQIRHIWADLTQHLEQKCNGSLDQSKTLHSGQNLNCTWAGIIHYSLSLAFQRWWYKKIQNNGVFSLCVIFYQIYCVIFFEIPFTFPQFSKCFLSNGTNSMHILYSGLDLQAVRFGYVILGKNWKEKLFY
jgi:hypothetical protein